MGQPVSILLTSFALLHAPGAGASTQADIIGVRATDIDGRVHRLGMADGRLSPVVLVFVEPGCPVSCRYAPRLNELYRIAAGEGVEFFGVLSDPGLSWREAGEYRREYALEFPILFDASGDLALRLGPTHVPEAFVVLREDVLGYRGRIDERFERVDRLRQEFASHDLLEALRAAAARRVHEPARTEPVGCVFEAWDVPRGPVTYTRDVAPILNANCVECHREGDIGPFPLQDYEEARRRARMLARVVSERIMPPWRAAPGAGEFRDERVLGEREIAVLTAWAEAGAPLGDPEDLLPAPPVPRTRWRLGEPDLLVQLPTDFAVPASGDDIYRYFVVPSGLTEDETIVGVDFRPGDPSVVHRCIAYLDQSGWGRRMDEQDPEPGFSVFGQEASEDEAELALLQAETVAGWAPGAEPYRMPRGLGQLLPAGGDFILEVHYHLNGKATTDRSSLALYFADEPVERLVQGLVIGTENIDIPAGEADYRRHVWMQVPTALELVDVTPHMHYLGREVEAIATLPGGAKLDLVRILDWDFRWQSTYVYREPVRLPAGSRIDVSFRFDNSAANPSNPSSPPIRVREGWRTIDEMCLFYLTIVPDEAEQMDQIYGAMFASFMRSGEPE